MKDKITKTVALYSSEVFDNDVSEVSEYLEDHERYVRTSEPLEVTFTPLPDKVILDGRVKSIDAEIEKTRAELTLRINDLTDQRQRLLCITHEVSDE